MNSPPPNVNESEAQKGASKLRKLFSTVAILPVCAFCLSLVSLYISELARRDASRVDTIKTEYDLYRDMARLWEQNPLMAHLFAVTGELYDLEVGRVKLAVAKSDEVELARLRLQERALAHYFFTAFEETYNLWKEAQSTDSRRGAILDGQLEYFRITSCSNSRLAWFWDAESVGKLAMTFGDNLRNYYANEIAKNCPVEKDARGPFQPLKRTALKR